MLLNSKSGSDRTWSHSFSSYLPLTSAVGHFEVFLAKDDTTAEQARIAHEERNEEALGELFGYPPCCVSTYLAQRHSREFISSSLRGIHHIQWGGNYLAQFFGTSYYTHLPCDFACQASKQLIAERARYNSDLRFRLVQGIARDMEVGAPEGNFF